MKKLNIRDKERNVSFMELWIKEQYQKLRMDPTLDNISNQELKEYLLKTYNKRRIVQGRLYNNATGDNFIMTQEQFINKYLNEALILSGYGCFYKNQDDSINISSAALESLGAMRKFNKDKMEAADHGTDEYVYYRILQLTYKVLMNSYYGILGEKNSVFYNPYVQNSITMTGQDLITTSIEAMEAFLSNNVPFEDTNDVITFIHNICNEDFQHNIMDYLDEPISRGELVDYLCNHNRNGREFDREVIENIVSKLSLEQVNRVYFKNQVLELISHSWFKDKLRNMIQYTYSEEPDPEMVQDLEDLKEKVVEFCHYDYLFEDRYKRSMKDKRKCIITIDTDSNFINLDSYIRTVSEMFDLDRKNENQQMTVMNIFVNITTEVLKKTFWTLTTNMGLVERAKPIINMKSEFVYKRIMLTRNKKNYAGIITGELGKTLKRPVLDMKGLSIRKTTVPKKLRKEFTEILQKDVLEAEVINLKNIINKYDELEETVESSLKSGNVEYLLPKNLEVIESYKTPDTIEPVRAALIWNALEPEDQIIPPEKINLVKLNCFSEDDPRLLNLKETHPDKYAAIMRTVFNHNTTTVKIDISRFGLSCVAIPKGRDAIPDYLIPFIDHKTMVNNNMTNGYIILESLGIYVDEVKTTKYKSNIISI